MMAAVGSRGHGASPPFVTGIGGCIETDVAIAVAGYSCRAIAQSPGRGGPPGSSRRRATDRCPPPYATMIVAKPAPDLLDRPQEDHVVAQRQAEQPGGAEDQPHADRTEMDLEENRDQCTDVTAAADGRAGHEGRRDLVNEAGRDDEDEPKADGRPNFVGYRTARGHEEIDDGEAQEQAATTTSPASLNKTWANTAPTGPQGFVGG